MAKNEPSNHQTKHINTRYHFVRELIEDGIIEVEFVRSENNDSNIFTKNLGRELFKRHSGKIMAEKHNNVNSLMSKEGYWKVSHRPPVFPT